MGAVYVAQQVRLERRVALKVIAPELAQDAGFRERFERESRIAASIDHPNVVPVYEAGEADGLLYIAMRYVPGSDLKNLIAERTRLDPQYAAGLTAQIAAALDAAHARGLVHRDIKPGNILLERLPDGDRAYLSDFGLTKRIASGSALTKTGVVVGTLDYIAPEQLQGGPIDARSDVYALSCLLFHALTGRVPYPRADDMAKMYAHAHMPPPSVTDEVPGLSPALGQVIARGMAKDPSERYVSAGDLGRAATAAVTGHVPALAERSVATGAAAPNTVADTVAPRQQPPPPPYAPPTSPLPIHAHHEAQTHVLPPRRSNTPVYVLAAVALLALGLAVGLVVTTQGGDEPAGTTAAGTGGDTQRSTAGPTTESGERTSTSEDPSTPVEKLPPGGRGGGTRFDPFASELGPYRVLVPAGAGWSQPRERQLNPGLFEATASGPGGLELIINYTPDEAASISPATSCRPTDHPQFAQARKCVFSGGSLDVCRSSRCVDYLLNDSSGGPGYAVLVGGGDPDDAERIADRVAASLEPIG